jgi:acetylornithine deacetylase/succinyl-diaminopimelate desuccinylase-like protein
MSTYEAVFRYIDDHFSEHLAETQRYLRQKSISLTNEGVLECAEMTKNYLVQLEAERAELADFDRGFPVVYGVLKSKRPNAKTLACYSLYDVMPIDPSENWKADPFGAEILDAEKIDLPKHYGPCIVARGARNQKGPIMALVNTLKTLQAVEGDIPCNIMFTFDGEEEMGSPNFVGPFRERYLNELKGIDAALYLNPSQNEGNDVIVYLGARGIIPGELRVRGGDWGGPAERSTFAADENWLDSPAWRLLKAVSTLRDDRGQVAIKGFYDNIRPWSADDKKLIQILVDRLDEQALKKRLGVRRFKGGKSAKELYPNYIMDPLLNIDGYSSGYTGPHIKTMFPMDATLKFDIRIVPDQDREDIIKKLRAHFVEHGFPEVEVEIDGGYGWTKTELKAELSQAAIRATEAHGVNPVCWPIYYAGVPQWVFNGPPLNKPVVSGGVGRMGREHNENEYIAVEGLRGYEKWLVTLLHEYADGTGKH